MGFKLVRIDSKNAHKIPLPEGNHSLGRGKFLDCSDKRVSRQHGTLKVTTNFIILKALHQNPCFYVKKGQDERDILQKDCEITLGNGDRFGLLPDVYWYEVLYCDMSQPLQDAVAKDSQNIVCNESDSQRTVYFEDKSDNMVATNEYDPTDKCAPNTDDQGINKCTDTKTNEIAQNDFNENELSTNDRDNLVPNNGSAAETSEFENLERSSPSLLTENQQIPPNDEPVIKEEPKSPLKRVHDNFESDEAAEKKIKIEPQDPQAGPSNDGNDSNKKADPVAANNLRPRERCMYGSKCYRRNPQHRIEFCHPGDEDWGDGDRGVCPWGRSCRRRDPRHFRDHDHPDGPQRPPHPQPGMRVVHRFGNVFYINANTVNFYDDHFNVEDEDGNRQHQKRRKKYDDTSISKDAILSGKRVRKTIRRVSWSGSESENDMEDPFLTDGSDEWEPCTDYTESQDF